MRILKSLLVMGVASLLTIGGVAFSAQAEAATYPCTTNQTLRQGQANSCVRAMQTYLNGYINAKLTIDGDFGPLTTSAVKKYQRLMKITADGVVGPQTRLAVFTHHGIPTNSGATQRQIEAASDAAIAMCRGWGFSFN